MEEEHPSSSFYKLVGLCLVGEKMYLLQFYSALVRKWIEFSARSTRGIHAQKNFQGENVAIDVDAAVLNHYANNWCGSLQGLSP